jgi:glycosyltransferase involved in cell wall biosynthesis
MFVKRGAKQRFVGAPAIGPVPNDALRPLISVMIPVYNNTEYLRETLESVLMQDLGPREMEIAVLDNCSSRGQSEEIVAEVGKGRISFYRHETNIGAIGNFNSCINRARGEWIHILHADDTVAPGFYARARQAIMADLCVSAVTCRVEYIDDVGRSIGLAEPEAGMPCVLPREFMWRQLTAQRFQFVSMIVRRAAYEELGGFRPELPHCADWDMWNRLVVAKHIFYEPEPLARYRLHSGSDSSQAFVTAENVRDERRSIQISCTYVSEGEACKLIREAMRLAGGRAARRARMYLVRGNWRGALRQANEALHCSLSPAVLARIAYHVALAVLSQIKATFRRVLRRERDESSTAQQ